MINIKLFLRCILFLLSLIGQLQGRRPIRDKKKLKETGAKLVDVSLSQSIQTPVQREKQAPTAHIFLVHVLLEKKTPQDELVWTVRAPHGFILKDPFHPKRHDTVHSTVCRICYKEGSLWIGRKRLAMNRIMIEPLHGSLTFNERRYAGSIAIIEQDGIWYVINSVDIEEYVCSVLRSESWPGWPLEVNKAFAIMQRSYVTAQLLQARGHKKRGKPILYDIGCTNLHQTYQGLHDSVILRQAVDETRGIVLAYNKRPIIAMYDSCCGGLIPAQIKNINFKAEPYLARPYACTHCTDCKVYRWKCSYTLAECEELLRTVDPSIKKITDMKVVERDTAGVVHQVKIKCSKGWKLFSRKTMYNLFKDIKSYSFTPVRQGKSMVFTGRGYGHHMGVCQWGAWQMVEQGWDYKKVLQFYYPGTTFMKLEFC